MAVRGGLGEARVAVIAALVAMTAACTQGVASEVGGDDDPPEITSASSNLPPATRAPISVAPRTPTLTPPPTSVVSTSTSVASTHTTAVTTPPTIADQFASALAPVEVSVLGAAVPAPAMDSVARLWLLLGRPPSTAELETALTATVRDGVPLDALATLLLHSPDVAVADPDAPPEQFVAGLYEGMLGRQGKPDEVAAWVRGLADGMSAGDVAVALAESPEAVRRTGTEAHELLPAVSVAGVDRTVSDSVLRLYLGLLIRLPNTEELDHDVDRYLHGQPLSAIADDLLRSNEYRGRRAERDPASVLAGLFEDVIGSHPSDAVIAGWASQLAEDATAGEIAAAFTESATVVARTGTAPPEPPDASPTTLTPVAIMPGTDFLAVGDSIMLGASNALTRQFPGIAIDAKVGRQFSEGVAIVRALAAQGTIPGTVIVHLGTNGTVNAARCDELMNLLAGKRVVLVNIHVPRPWEAGNNDVLAACAARYGATLVDWHTDAVDLAPDGYHLGGSGPDAYATLIAAAL